jgi:hypothetical protein
MKNRHQVLMSDKTTRWVVCSADGAAPDKDAYAMTVNITSPLPGTIYTGGMAGVSVTVLAKVTAPDGTPVNAKLDNGTTTFGGKLTTRGDYVGNVPWQFDWTAIHTANYTATVTARSMTDSGSDSIAIDVKS